MNQQKASIMANPGRQATTDPRLLQRGITQIEHKYSYGIIGYKFVAQTPMYLVIQHKYNREWGFPKGHWENYENRNGHDTAMREFYEETGLTFTMTNANRQNGNVISVDWDHPLVAQYEFTRGRRNQRLCRKWTVLFAAEISENAKPRIIRPREIANIQWTTKAQFDQRNKHKEYRDIIRTLDRSLRRKGTRVKTQPVLGKKFASHCTEEEETADEQSITVISKDKSHSKRKRAPNVTMHGSASQKSSKSPQAQGFLNSTNQRIYRGKNSKSSK